MVQCRYVSAATRQIPPHVRQFRLGERVRWARRTAGLSHDRLVEQIGRSNRGHLIKIEKGTHVPGVALRDLIADACDVPRDLFSDGDDDEEDAPVAFGEAMQLMFDRTVAAAVERALAQ